MNNIDRLNELIIYIEKNLTENIDYRLLAQILCVNEYSLHRIFNFISGISLAEYIRYRRLSCAALELLHSNIKIIDLAIKYGYDSSISFSRAFKNFHRINPSQIKNNQSYLRNYAPLNFSNELSKNINLNFKILQKDSFELYSIYKKCEISKIKEIAPVFWKNIEKKQFEIFDDTTFGIIEYDNLFPNPQNAKYHIASPKKFKNSSLIIIPKSTWAIFNIEEVSGEAMSKFSKYVYKNWVPYSGYNIRNIPEIEVYYNDHTEWWLPLEKVR